MLAAELIATCIAELRDRYRWEPDVLDFGGGYAHERDPESGEPAGSHVVATPEEYAEAITATLRDALALRGLREPHLLLEPGRRLVSNATVLLTRVGVVKRLPTGVATWINVDASTNHCPRAPLQGYYYEIVHATEGLLEPELVANVVGPTCVIDLLGEDRSLPKVTTGDLLAVLDVGGYAEVLSSQFNMLPRPAKFCDGTPLRGHPPSGRHRRHSCDAGRSGALDQGRRPHAPRQSATGNKFSARWHGSPRP